MIAGLISGLLLSAASAFLLLVIFPAEKKQITHATPSQVSVELKEAQEVARMLGIKLERVSKAIHAEETGQVRHIENPGRSAIFQ